MTSIFGMLGVDLTAPDHTTLSRRGQHLALALRRARPGTTFPAHRRMDEYRIKAPSRVQGLHRVVYSRSNRQDPACLREQKRILPDTTPRCRIGAASWIERYRSQVGGILPTTVVDAMEDGRTTSASAQAFVRRLGG